MSSYRSVILIISEQDKLTLCLNSCSYGWTIVLRALAILSKSQDQNEVAASDDREQSELEARRAFLKGCGKMGLAASPGVTLLLSGTSASGQVNTACTGGVFSCGLFGLGQCQCCGTTLYWTWLFLSGSIENSDLCSEGASLQSFGAQSSGARSSGSQLDAEIERQLQEQGMTPEEAAGRAAESDTSAPVAGEPGTGGGAAGETPQ